MKHYISIVAVVAGIVTLSSCYKIFRTSAPKEVTAGETFPVTITVTYDGDQNAQFKNDWSVAGVRVPKGWTVTAPALNHRQYAENWVYYEDGSPAAKRSSMSTNTNLSKLYNEGCAKEGYDWFGFQTRTKVSKNVTACWRNGCDSIVGTFLVTVPGDCPAGTYTLDFIAGDEEDDAGADKYATAKDASTTRLFHAGTFTHSYLSRVNGEGARTIVVKAVTDGISSVTADSQGDAPVYNVDGVRVDKPRRGIYIKNGKKILNR